MVKDMGEGGVKKTGKSGDIFMDSPFLNSSTNSEKLSVNGHPKVALPKVSNIR